MLYMPSLILAQADGKLKADEEENILIQPDQEAL